LTASLFSQGNVAVLTLSDYALQRLRICPDIKIIIIIIIIIIIYV